MSPKSYNISVKKPIKTLVVLVLGIVGFIFFYKKPNPPVTSFKECVAAGNPVLESYPEQCIHQGKSYTRNIGNELDLWDQISVTMPRPGDFIGSPLVITGQARGTWFFEASFPVLLVDEEGNTIVESFATAQGEWITEEFVSFYSSLEFTPSGKGKNATLIFKKANPSGKDDHDNQLEIPVIY